MNWLKKILIQAWRFLVGVWKMPVAPAQQVEKLQAEVAELDARKKIEELTAERDRLKEELADMQKPDDKKGWNYGTYLKQVG